MSCYSISLNLTLTKVKLHEEINVSRNIIRLAQLVMIRDSFFIVFASHSVPDSSNLLYSWPISTSNGYLTFISPARDHEGESNCCSLIQLVG